MAKKRRRGRQNPTKAKADAEFQEALQLLYRHPLFSYLMYRVGISRGSNSEPFGRDGLAIAYQRGHIVCHPTRHATQGQWMWAMAHCLLHFGFEHFQEREDPIAWNTACDLVVSRFLADIRLGEAPAPPPVLPARDEQRIYEKFVRDGIPVELMRYTTVPDRADLILDGEGYRRGFEWGQLLANGMQDAVEAAIDVAGGARHDLYSQTGSRSTVEQARSWVLSSYPLLGSLAQTFKLIEDPRVCARFDISIAAIDEVAEEVYVNRAADLDLEEAKFVLAHEYLHVGLRHLDRRQGRDPYLWNVACDFVINDWLMEMEVGRPPRNLLYDPDFNGMSAEDIYDLIVRDLRRYRKLCTLRGHGFGDMMERSASSSPRDWRDRDAFYRSCLARGLLTHHEQSRGLLPSGLVQEIRALQTPPLPWDVELARWFDEWFPAVERRRSYARISRRQSATPDIPRPRYIWPEELDKARTFGVVLDTSGSMSAKLLGRGLGAVASFAASRDVPAARVVFCDAAAYDQGYMPVSDIAGRVRVVGRGGTILQPGIDLLERAKDFPLDGPILIITDGDCDVLRIRRPHALLVPKGARLPFRPKGPLFEMTE